LLKAEHQHQIYFTVTSQAQKPIELAAIKQQNSRKKTVKTKYTESKKKIKNTQKQLIQLRLNQTVNFEQQNAQQLQTHFT